MINKILLLFILFSPYFLFGQGNLQFNQVLSVGTTAQTVPAGKVWKVETYMQSRTVLTEFYEFPGCTYPDRQHPFLINTKPYYQVNGSPGHGSSGVFMAVSNLLPLWLKSGDTVQTTCPDNFLSILEFNIIP